MSLSYLPFFVNNPKIFGHQLILDENDRVTSEEQKLLISACDIGIGELPAIVRQYNGIAVPSHIDRPSNSLIANLGFIPPDIEFTCYEVKDNTRLPGLINGNPALSRARIINNSDAHSLIDIAERRHSITLRERDAAALIEALATVALL